MKTDWFDTYAEAQQYLDSLPDVDAELVFTFEDVDHEQGPARLAAMKRDGKVIKVVILHSTVEELERRSKPQ